MKFLNEDLGYAFDFFYSNPGYRITDGGSTWTPINSFPSDFHNLSFIDEDQAWLVGEDCIMGSITPIRDICQPSWIFGDSIACTGEATYSIRSLSYSDSVIWSVNGNALLTPDDFEATVFWMEEGLQTLEAQLTNGCGDTTLLETLRVRVESLPILSIMQDDSVLTTNVSGPVQWYRDEEAIEGATDSFYLATTAGTYYVTFTNSCGTISSENLTVSMDPEHSAEIRLFPNPVRDWLIIELSPESQVTNVEVLDINGRIVQQAHKLTSNRYELDTRELPGGVYIIRLESTDSSLIRKIEILPE